MDKFSAETYISRRKRLKKAIGTGKILLLGNQQSSINFKDNWYPFRQDSTFLYYFGLSAPGLYGYIDIDADREIIFGNEPDIDDIIWTGKVPRIDDMAAEVGIYEVLPTMQVINFMGESLHFLPPYRSEHSILLSKLFNRKPWKVERKFSRPLIKAVVKQRIQKSEEEIDQLDLATKITDEMHLAVMRAARPGMKEHELVGVASEVSHKYNVPFSFPPILTKNGQTLHNHYHGNVINERDMILFDGGCESPAGYAGDITRTFPASGKFTSLQRDMYDVVHNAYSAAVHALAPAVLFKDVHRIACESLVSGLTQLGFMKGNPVDAVENGAHTLFFQCGLGHLIGLDVHDMENFGEERVGYTDKVKKNKEFGWKSLRLGRALKRGYALTIEPGIYIIPELIDMRRSEGMYTDFVNYDKLETIKDFGGIRLEDDFVITEAGAKLLGIDMPRTAGEVEKVCSE